MKYTIWCEIEGGGYYGRGRCLYPNCEYSYSPSSNYGNEIDAKRAAKRMLDAHYTGAHESKGEQDGSGNPPPSRKDSDS